MKKLILLLLAGLLLSPLEMLADKYNSKRIASATPPPRNPSQYCIDFYLDENTGDMAITPSSDITGLTITLTANGVTYINTTVSLSTGQSYTVVTNGKTTLIGDTVELNGETTIELGAELKIKIIN